MGTAIQQHPSQPHSLHDNSLNANAQSFIPLPGTSTSPRCGDKLSVVTKLETIPESPMVSPAVPLLPHSDKSFDTETSTNSTTTNTNKLPSQQQQQQQQLVSSLMPSMYAPITNPNDSLALIPAIDQNGLLVMIPPSLCTPGSLFTPLVNTENTDNKEIENHNHLLHSQPISDMQSLLGYDPFINTYSNQMYMAYPPPHQPNNINMAYPPFATSPSYKEFVDANSDKVTSSQ